jgi:hypothetical protein
MTESSKLLVIRLLFFFSAGMWTVWGVSGRASSTWPIFAVVFFIVAVGSPTRPYGPNVMMSLRTLPGVRMAVAIFAAINSVLAPLIILHWR